MKTELLFSKRSVISFLIANIVIQFLCYIDEGDYDFNWMKDPSNWIFYILYVIVLWLIGLLTLDLIVSKK